MRRIKKFSFLFIFFLLPTATVLWATGQSTTTNTLWKAGVAKVNITPEQYIWMGGYAFRNHPADGKITDLWAKALALEDAAGQKAVIITTDLVGVSKTFSDEVRRRIGAKLHLSYAQIIINTSHTHSGPVVGNLSSAIYALDAIQRKKVDEYAAQLKTKLVDLVVTAFGRLQPAYLFSGNGITRFQVNRHTNKEAALTATTHLNGPNDYAVPVIRVTDSKNKVMAVLFGYACHNTTLGLYQWSGDYAGFAQIEVEKAFPGATALFFQGAGGDQNPLPRGTVSRAKQYGAALATAVEAVINENMKPLESRLSVTYAEINLPFAKRPPTKEELVQIINDTSANAYPDYLKRSAKTFLGKLDKGDTLMSSYAWYPVQVWNVGNQAIFTFGGELTVGYSVALKRIFGQDIFVMGYTNDIMSYIPTAKMLAEGGYETIMSPVFTTPYDPSIEPIIIDHATKAAKEVGVHPKSSIPSGKR